LTGVIGLTSRSWSRTAALIASRITQRALRAIEVGIESEGEGAFDLWEGYGD